MRVLETEVELTQARELMMRSIFTMHPLWKMMPPDLEEAQSLFKYLIAESHKHQLSIGLYVDGKLAAIVLGFPVSRYLAL